ncbi:hypothetical protein I5E68_03230 [Novosphingobium sp. YJ-S2-02]|uniref:Phage shock protein B n=1 Tax=Novosphingobium aureum TaxID=2792964 RepID=A0A931H9Q5_9SPHN|nr:hypothetical protein [Novosphingobium aureum]MBH0111965.1 hypothetical protein [Novosphingobium aureum]
MNFWTAVVIIFVIGCVTWLKAQKQRGDGIEHRSGRGRAGRLLDRDDDVDHEIEQLRERIAVLERIATDDRQSKDLAREIEKLRD